ncbi:MAG TPA: patatin-like phospholipase family protein [Gemmatimonadales bacterium]|nr:patatin-like phospholipase family protein [Gemmatimonadales bacterium]
MTDRVVAVLSGGGVKAAAHLGAVRALVAAGLAPARYVGTSMGAVIGAGLAAGLPAGEVAERLFLVRQRDVFAVDRTVVLKGLFARGLLRPEPFRRTLERLLPVARFEDLAVPLTVTATDLDSGALLAFGAGGQDAPLLDALCASCALPPFFPPYLMDGRRLADGGLRAVVPLEVAARFPAELVAAVDVGAGFDMDPEPQGVRTPALLRLQGDAQWALMASNTALQRALWNTVPGRPPLLWIRPRVRRGDTFATEQLRRYIEEGERAANYALAARKA